VTIRRCSDLGKSVIEGREGRAVGWVFLVRQALLLEWQGGGDAALIELGGRRYWEKKKVKRHLR